VAALEADLRRQYGVAAVGRDGEIVAVGAVRHDPQHSKQCAEISLLIEDRWQRKGLGSELTAHLAAPSDWFSRPTHTCTQLCLDPRSSDSERCASD
jgi:deoxycytidylate deaminase